MEIKKNPVEESRNTQAKQEEFAPLGVTLGNSLHKESKLVSALWVGIPIGLGIALVAFMVLAGGG